MEFIQTHWAELGPIGLLVLRLVESVAVLFRANKVISFVNVIKEFFRIG